MPPNAHTAKFVVTKNVTDDARNAPIVGAEDEIPKHHGHDRRCQGDEPAAKDRAGEKGACGHRREIRGMWQEARDDVEGEETCGRRQLRPDCRGPTADIEDHSHSSHFPSLVVKRQYTTSNACTS